MSPLPYRLLALEVPDAGTVRVLVVGADPLARAGLAALFGAYPGYEVATIAESDLDLDRALQTFAPDAVVWDVGVTGEHAELDWTDAGLPVLALVADDMQAAEAWQAGAGSLLLRDAPPDALAAALVAAREGLVALDPVLAERLLDVPLAPDVPDLGPDALTPREHEVLCLVAEGLPNKGIADQLGITPHTVKFHVAAVLSKLGAQSRTEAVTRAARLGYLVL